jgi:hypothetical protein
MRVFRMMKVAKMKGYILVYNDQNYWAIKSI